METLPPTHTAHLFPPLHAELIALLRSLDPSAWARPTVAGRWRVRDVAAHLLDGDLRRLSAERDGHLAAPPRPIRDGADLVAFLDELNASWIQAAERLSPPLLVELLEWSGARVSAMVSTLDPAGPALFPVAWAGESRSECWMDVGREFTERWHHQMQIRDAVGVPLLLEPRWTLPLFELSLRALPPAYRSAGLPPAPVVIAIEGLGSWTLDGTADWGLRRETDGKEAARIEADADTAWRILYNALSPGDGSRRIRVTGGERWARPFLRARSVMVPAPS